MPEKFKLGHYRAQKLSGDREGCRACLALRPSRAWQQAQTHE
jgi:hypothetical protein